MVQQTPSKKQSESTELVVPALAGMRQARFRLKAVLRTKAVVLFVLAIVGIARADQNMPYESLPTAWKSEAELTDVFFLNPSLGWAVGAQGVILRTTNGGKQWSEISQAPDLVADDISLKQKLNNMRTGTRTRYTGVVGDSAQSQQQTVRCRFESVCFVDSQHGWIAGGYEVPYVGRTRAVVMQTDDGGQTWQPIRSLVIPRINKIHFTDRLTGWAVGRTGNLFQTGVFHTVNGGQTWSSKSSSKMPGWTDAVNTSQGLLTIDYEGTLGLLRGSDNFEASVIRSESLPQVNQIKMVDKQQGWAVGEQGSLLRTDDGGRSFSPLQFGSSNAADPSARIATLIKEFDLKTVAVTSRNIWFAGDPGTLLFAVERETGKAIGRRIPIQSRINKIVFADDQHGWAVGALGCILSTSDGGETWALQRGRNRTSAMLVINSSPHLVGYELFSKYAGQENHLCASVLIGSNRNDGQRFQAVTQATDRLGGATTNLIHSIDDAPRSTKKLVRLIRSLQPRLIVLNTQSSGGVRNGQGDSGKIQLLVNDAIRLAADRNAFDRQIVDAGLKPWQVSRLATRDSVGTVSIDARQLLPRTGKLIEDQIAISRAISGQSVVPAQTLSYRIDELTRNGTLKAGDLLSGLVQDSNTQRSNGKHKYGNLTSIHQASAKQKTFDQFLKFESNTPQDVLVWRQQVQAFAMKMDSDVAGVWLIQLAERYFAAGKPELAAASTELLVMRWSEHAFAPAALSWLAHYYSSDEFGQIEFLNRVRTGQLGSGANRVNQSSSVALASANTDKDFQATPQVIQAGGVSQLVWAPVKETAKSDLASNGKSGEAGETIAVQKQKFLAARNQRAGQYLKQLGRRDPELAAGLQFKLMEAQIARQISGKIINENLWANLAQRRDALEAGISIGAQRELAIGGFTNKTDQPITKLTCVAAPQRPKLDGKLEDACWKNAIQTGNVIASTVNLEASQNQTQANQDVTVMAYDDEFLYVGFVCHKVQGHYYNLRKQARPRDPDLSRRDRVELTIDTDRDYRSSFKFVIDHRGWVNESCSGSRGWDPDWYVAQSEDKTTWTVEVAIPLKQIAAEDLGDKTTWAFSIKRKIFDDHNVWKNRSSAAVADRRHAGGLQIGMTSNPRDFELVRFGDQ